MGREGKNLFSTEACNKMASVPDGSVLEWPSENCSWPIVSKQNVYVFAGMPSVFRNMFERAAADGRFKGSNSFVSRSLHLDAEEGEVLEALQRTVDAFPGVH